MQKWLEMPRILISVNIDLKNWFQSYKGDNIIKQESQNFQVQFMEDVNQNSGMVIGILIGVKLLFSGWILLMTGLAARGMAKELSGAV